MSLSEGRAKVEEASPPLPMAFSLRIDRPNVIPLPIQSVHLVHDVHKALGLILAPFGTDYEFVGAFEPARLPQRVGKTSNDASSSSVFVFII
ncbi:MAG: hypothetical protein HZB26_02080 [Candidatus Hydrogenedentes bacterium]|nr:hypothetical protein [Candidatus Hydrogenedentota bacterium]